MRKAEYPDIPQNATLQLEVELLSWFKVVDVCEDGGVSKKILSEVFERAEKKNEMTVKYEVKLEDATVVAKSSGGGVEFLVNDESWDMEAPQKLEYAAKQKEEGNLYFKAGKYKRAV